MEKIDITGPAGRIQGVYHQAKSPSRDVLIVCHPHPLFGGTMDNKVVTTIGKTFLDGGINVIRFNYRGVGESEGEYGGISGEVDDALAVFEWLKQHHKFDRLFLAGFSFGAYIAAKTTQVLTQKGVEVPHLLMMAPSVENSPFELATPLAAPCTVIMGKLDELVPFNAVQSWVDGQGSGVEMRVLPEATHFFHRQLIKLKAEILSVLSKYTDV